MSNHSRPNRLDGPSDTADDWVESPPFRQTHLVGGSLEQGGHGIPSFLNRPLPRRPATHRGRFINQQGEGNFSHIAVSESSDSSTTTPQVGSPPAVVSSPQAYPASSDLHPLSQPLYAHVHPYFQQASQHENLVGNHYKRHDQHLPPQNQPQSQFTIPHTSPPDSHRPASLTPSSSDSSLLRYPYNPRLPPAQYQAASVSGFDLGHPDPGLSSGGVDLIPIQLPDLASAHIIPQDPLIGFSQPAPAGHPFFHHKDEDDLMQNRQPGALQFSGGYPISFMQDPELSILNAESYDDGIKSFRAPRSLPPGRSPAANGQKSAGQSRKRAKAQSVEDGEPEEEEKKRSRGRPRLDTNDETAKDRRRTQIRLAQRAYRNRKETAIQSLEKKVNELRRTNEEMSKEFMKLYDFAVGKGMHESTPDFGRQLQVTTEKFVSLARKISDQTDRDDLAASQEQDDEARETSPKSGPEKLSDKSGSPDVAKPDQVLYGGYTKAAFDEITLESTPRSQVLTAVHTTSWAADNEAHVMPQALSQAPLGYEIVTEPTPDNASFQFGMSFGTGMNYGLLNQPDQLFSGSPYSLLSLPSSYAYQERTFGRRLQRTLLEKAYLLLQMPHAPPGLVSSAFGFCLLFESKERIIERLANRLSVNQRETLFNWKFPFLHLGGGGTWFEDMNEMNVTEFPRIGKSRRTVGNQGSAEPQRQKVDSMFGMGPWDSQTEEIRDSAVDQKLRMHFPGFDGEFYDTDEVEWALQRRGVTIPAAADFVTAEIDPADFAPGAPIGGGGFDGAMDNGAANAHAVSSNYNLDTADSSVNQWLGQQAASKSTGADQFGFPTTQRTSRSSDSTSDQMNIDPNLGDDMFGLGASASNQGSTTGPGKRLVTINVEALIQEITLKSVCLGRSPGIRPKDLDVAFWGSLTT